jgi:hypothetical protein
MRRILAICFFTLIVSGCAENKWGLTDISTPTMSNAKDSLASGDLENNITIPTRSHGFNNDRIARFVENAEQRKTEMVPVKPGQHITLKFTKSYISAGNHLCKLFELSQSIKVVKQKISENVFCYLNDRWELLVPLSYREGQREIYLAIKVAFLLQEKS